MSNEVDKYINGFPEEVQDKLNSLRNEIRKLVSEAEEVFSYQMPTYRLKKNLVHFAAYKNHIGFYPAPSAILHFEQDLKNYKTSKGAIQFPIDQDLPLDLIKRIVLFRVEENLSGK